MPLKVRHVKILINMILMSSWTRYLARTAQICAYFGLEDLDFAIYRPL